MTTTSRRSFLRNALAAVCAAPLLVRAAFAAKEPQYILGIDRALSGVESLNQYAVTAVGAAIKVPSNRRRSALYVGPSGQAVYNDICYDGDWDGTFKLEPGCSNPAYLLADLIEREGGRPHWPQIYWWGRHCDEPVIDWNDGVPQIDPPKWEPRFECNAALGSVAEQQGLKDALASVERAWRVHS